MSATNLRNDIGPYKATKLWNDIVRVFRTGMPISRHWRQLRSYDDCFVASEAVNWLLDFLHQHHEYGTDITRAQVVKLLQKFHRNNYIEDVRGIKYNSEQFVESNRLFRFVALSPLKTPQWPRPPLSSCTNLTQAQTAERRRSSLSEVKGKITFSNEPLPKQQVEEKTRANENANSNNCNPQPNDNMATHATHGAHVTDGTAVTLNKQSVRQLWKSKVVHRLTSVLGVDDISEVGGISSMWRAEYVRHNMTVVHKNGYVTGIAKSELPPCWVISAMRFLSKWPNKGSESFPEYPGFEKDVFVMIGDYFGNIRCPLTTYSLYPLLVSIYRKLHSHPSPITTSHSSQETATLTNRHNSLVTQNTYVQSRDSPQFQVHCHHTTSRYDSCHNQNRNGVIIQYDMPTTPTAVVKKSHITSSYIQRRQNQSEPITLPSHQNHMAYSLPDGDGYLQKKSLRNQNSSSAAVTVGNRAVRTSQARSVTASVQRTKSFSDILSVPRVETAFVGDEALTVYHGIRRHNAENIDKPVSRAKSVHHLNTRPDSLDVSPLLYDPTVKGIISGEGQWNSRLPTRSPCKRVQRTSSERCPRVSRMNSYASSDGVVGGSVKSASYGSHNLTSPTSRQQAYQTHSTPSVAWKTPTPSAMFSESSSSTSSSMVEAYQLALLFIPASNRRVLHMMLKLMNKLSDNSQLRLSSFRTNKQLVLSTLWRCVIRCENQAELDEVTAQEVTSFLVENYEQILAVPEKLKEEILLEIQKHELSSLKLVQRTATAQLSQAASRNDEKNRPAPAQPLAQANNNKAYCERITSEQYQTQVSTQLHVAMNKLLDDMINDSKMSVKEKTKKLKQFQRAYPEIFSARFPDAEKAWQLVEQTSKSSKSSSRIKPFLFSNPRELLRKLR